MRNFSYLHNFFTRCSLLLEEVGGGLFAAMLLLCCLSCSPTPEYITEAELLAYIRNEENGLIKTRQAGGVTLQVMYRPNDLLVLQEVGNQKDSATLVKAHRKYQDYAYFILSIDVEGKNALYSASGDMSSFSANLQTLAFGMSDKVSLITSAQDTVEVADYIFDRTYGMGSTTLLFVFSREKLERSDWFSFNLKDFGVRSGDQRFRFRTKDLLDTPGLIDLKTIKKPIAFTDSGPNVKS